MIQTIVCAADLGVFTPLVLQHVTGLAHHCGARIVVVHAVEPLGTLGHTIVKAYLPEQASATLYGHGVDDLIASIRERVVALLADDFLEFGGLDRVNEVVVEAGRPADVILNCAASRNADLIVMGSHGPGQDDSYALGSVASRVLQSARIPVYLVPMLSHSPAEHAARPQDWAG